MLLTWSSEVSIVLTTGFGNVELVITLARVTEVEWWG